MTTESMTSIARPYAKAAFEFALANNALPAWEAMLKTGATLAEDQSVKQLLASPAVSTNDIGKLFCDVLAPKTDTSENNFIRLLAENKRLLALPALFSAFVALRAEHDKTIDVDVTSAVELDAAYQHKLEQALTKRLQKKVSLHCSIDPSLIAGVKVVAGDLVLDGSVRGKLNRLIEFI